MTSSFRGYLERKKKIKNVQVGKQPRDNRHKKQKA